MNVDVNAKRVLIVEDDADIRETLAEFLRDEGYDVACAQHGRDALDQLKVSALPSVILLDLSMPVMDGFEFRSEQLKDPRLASIPVVVITAGQQLRDLPADLPVIAKPPNLETLVSMVQRYCDASSS